MDTDERTATFDVDGQSVTRKIPLQFEGTLIDYLAALKAGLAIEGANADEEAMTRPLDDAMPKKAADINDLLDAAIAEAEAQKLAAQTPPVNE